MGEAVEATARRGWKLYCTALVVVLLIFFLGILAALARRRWPIVISVSVGLYVIELITRWRVVPSQFEDSFPLLTWQLLFVVGMIAGFYRREVVEWFRGRTGTVVVGVAVVLSVAFAVFSWNNPYLASAADVRLGLIPNDAFRPVYDALFGRTHLEPGRLVNVFLVVIVGYALLDRYWKPLYTAVGWFFVPLGQATLYVFVMHVFFALTGRPAVGVR